MLILPSYLRNFLQHLPKPCFLIHLQYDIITSESVKSYVLRNLLKRNPISLLEGTYQSRHISGVGAAKIYHNAESATHIILLKK